MSDFEAIPHTPEADSFQFRASLDALKHALLSHKWLILATTLISTGLVIAYVSIWPPTFQSELMIAADSEKDIQRTAFYQGWNIFRRESLVDEGTLMLSAPVLKEVVRRLDLKYEEVYHPFMNYAIHLWGQSWVGRNYRAVKAWLFPKPVNPYAPSDAEIEQGKTLTDFEAGVQVKQLGEASIGVLIVKASTQRVSEIANTIAEVYFEQRRARYVREAEEAYNSLSTEADKALGELEVLDKDIKQFRANSGMALLFEKDRVQIGQWQILRAQVTDLEAAMADNLKTLSVINQQLAAEGAAMGTDRVFKDVATQDRLTKLEMQLASMKQLFHDSSPEVREIEEQIRIASASMPDSKQKGAVRNSVRVGDAFEALRTRKMGIESWIAGARESLQVKKTELELMRTQLAQIPEKQKIAQEFERKQSALELKYRGLNDKLAVAAVSMATAKSAPSALRVITPAATPEQAIWPKTRLLVLAGMAFGAIAGGLGALLLELMFVRANRYRLWEKNAEYRVFAIVNQDEKFLGMLFPRDAHAKRLTIAPN